MSAELLKALTAVAKMRGTSVEHEIMKHNVEVVEKRRLMRHPPALTEAERAARVKACSARSLVKAREKRRAARVDNSQTVVASLSENNYEPPENEKQKKDGGTSMGTRPTTALAPPL